ncbi:acetyl-CoA carboxylase biotin carboxylase subunit [Nonomuraea aridisoli]|uniref:biotin carboxylase n=1 Tax=Nonomuraea aridisoli TaxID=2070368 RepID=A0A2W2E8J5_9ACTN|nr:acetyl-CoA carboxylase biotin carboxylase subunit [Nonomuraea aridisoli]PZG18721.1 pyruvate carboxylase subunit A [Nonomuraea aridisoli]
MFTKVLIANRGEIAVRVARACRELGAAVVAVYSDEDRDSAVVRLADEAVRIGPGPARRSYLYMPAIIEAALRTGADALHPGYGFLSEDPDLAQVCQDNGIVFVGPPPHVMECLGDKVSARRLMAATGLPLLPGTLEPVRDAKEAARLAAEIGFPLILKAAAGGGGRGMRVVREERDLAQAFSTTRATGQALFGDPRLYAERYLHRARHVEVQIVADRHGNIVQLGLRDCSVQRRHQKLVEESPAPGLPDDVVAEMSACAVRGARAAGYVGAGTFEFLVDPDDGRFYFMEVNSRIQVEHPVTEMVTGVDLVQEQLRIAWGLPLSMKQEDVAPRGCAIETRINAEDPARGFVPAPGVLEEFTAPGGPFVRVDTHAYPGYRIPAAYDPLVAKLIVWGPDREQALARMKRALGELRTSGPRVTTTAGFLTRLMDDPAFRAATHTTSLVEEMERHE